MQVRGMPNSKLAECWQSRDPAMWQSHLDDYSSRIAQLGKDTLADLDRYQSKQYPS